VQYVHVTVCWAPDIVYPRCAELTERSLGGASALLLQRLSARTNGEKESHVTIRSILSGIVAGGLLLSTTTFASAHSVSPSATATAEHAIVLQTASVVPTLADHGFTVIGDVPVASMQSDAEMQEAIEDLIEVLEELIEALEELEAAMTE
jgi:hypothetical protein